MYYYSTPASGQQPYIVLNPGATWNGSPFAIEVDLPNIFNGAPTLPIAQDTLISVTAGVSTSYGISVAANSPLWTFDNTPIRAGVSSGILQFLITLEKLGTLTTGSMALIQQILAQYLPLTFPETLYYRYGLNPAMGYVDLQPGMRLRVDFEAYQQLNQVMSPLLNGFVGTGTSYIQVVENLSSNGTLLTSFSPLLAVLGYMSVAANSGGGAGAVDLSGQPFAFQYFRLFYPKTLGSADASGSAIPANNIAIVGANKVEDMANATAQYRKTGTFPSYVTAAFFRGRAMITPEIPVFLNGQAPIWVEVGTTLRQALRGTTYVPRLSGVNYVPTPAGLLNRWLLSFTNATWGYPGWKAAPNGQFNLLPGSTGYAIYPSNADGFDVPLFGGDAIVLNQ